jgi:hypothetical protein
MAKKAHKKGKIASASAETVERALKYPGVQEAMRVYDEFRAAEAPLLGYQAYLYPTPIGGASTSTEPAFA